MISAARYCAIAVQSRAEKVPPDSFRNFTCRVAGSSGAPPRELVESCQRGVEVRFVEQFHPAHQAVLDLQNVDGSPFSVKARMGGAVSGVGDDRAAFGQAVHIFDEDAVVGGSAASLRRRTR